MKKYKIQTWPEAMRDTENVYNYIAYTLLMPDTAAKYRWGIFETIAQLSWMAGSLPVNRSAYLQYSYGPNARTLIYKKMIIVYNIIDDTVVVRRVMARGLIR
jgi:hypothetical protein